MNERQKLPRLRWMNEFTTGNAQDWTYEYTWEDWDSVIYTVSSLESPHVYEALAMYLGKYFSAHPEKLQDHPRFENMSLEEIKENIEARQSIYQLYSADKIATLEAMWRKMMDEVNEA